MEVQTVGSAVTWSAIARAGHTVVCGSQEAGLKTVTLWQNSGFMPQPPPQTADWEHITEVFSSIPDG